MNYLARGLRANGPKQWFQDSRVNVAGLKQVTWEPLYDTLDLPATGATQLTFFQNAVGKAGKTLSDTNMDLEGMLPAGKAFLCTGIQLEFISAVAPDESGSGSPTSPFMGVNMLTDLRAFSENGHLIMRIASKDYCRQAPLGKFPPNVSICGAAARAATTSTDLDTNSVVTQFNMSGREFSINSLLLEANQNFSVSLNDIPSMPAITARGGTHKVRCKLNGFLARNAQ